jgi:hypothetical protein
MMIIFITMRDGAVFVRNMSNIKEIMNNGVDLVIVYNEPKDHVEYYILDEISTLLILR